MLLKDFFATARPFSLPVSDVYDAASYIAGKSYAETKSSYDIFLDDNKVNAVIERWAQGEPTAYITGRKEFYGREFKVNPAVLIPRPETETLVESALTELKGKGGRILDLCSGSGCIILSVLAENEGTSGIGVDISAEAIKVANDNAAGLFLSERVEFIRGDACAFHAGELFDLVLCNPPYIGESEYGDLERQVKFEPKLALTAPDDGLFFYKNILSKIHLLCKTSGTVFFEVGFNQGRTVADIAETFGLKTSLLKDTSGVARVVKARF